MLYIVILFLLVIILYYTLIKKTKKVGDVVYVFNSLLSLSLIISSKISNIDFIAITNPFTKRIHVKTRYIFDNIDCSSNLFRHELIHIYQIEYLGFCKFLFLYIMYSIKYGYTYNPFEKQARFYENIDTVSREDIYNDIKYNLLVKI
ncbi:hypothetical protein R4K55_10410 [Brachyspira alvinipulli]|uniref:hypothetical protein n=1 Tax=Brachyspira alvinipulli TaxID=84379 RepID=UPI0026162230|nr:hypothetical protein [uncultured Brachyspira sp.]